MVLKKKEAHAHYNTAWLTYSGQYPETFQTSLIVSYLPCSQQGKSEQYANPTQKGPWSNWDSNQALIAGSVIHHSTVTDISSFFVWVQSDISFFIPKNIRWNNLCGITAALNLILAEIKSNVNVKYAFQHSKQMCWTSKRRRYKHKHQSVPMHACMLSSLRANCGNNSSCMSAE